MKKIYLFVFFGFFGLILNAQNVATFDEFQLEPDSFRNGSDGSGGFNSGGFWFPNDYNAEWQSWIGFSISNMKDSVTSGWENQYSAITASGVDQSDNYAVVYVPGELKMEFENPVKLSGFYITNNTYTYLSMKFGDAFTKKFGGADDSDPDYLKLIVTGADALGNVTDSVEFFLADFTFENNKEDYILKNWEWVDLTSLDTVSEISLQLESTDVGDFGMNTPAYFCIDNFNGSEITASSEIPGTNELKIYPNPVKTHFRIDLPGDAELLVLVNNSGRTFLTKEVSGKNHLFVHEVADFKAGIYIVKVKTGSGIISKKIIKL